MSLLGARLASDFDDAIDPTTQHSNVEPKKHCFDAEGWYQKQLSNLKPNEFLTSHNRLEICGLNAVNNIFIAKNYTKRLASIDNMNTAIIHCNKCLNPHNKILGVVNFGNICISVMNYILGKVFKHQIVHIASKPILEPSRFVFTDYLSLFAVLTENCDYIVNGWEMVKDKTTKEWKSTGNAHYCCIVNMLLITDAKERGAIVVKPVVLTELNCVSTLRRFFYNTTYFKLWQVVKS